MKVLTDGFPVDTNVTTRPGYKKNVDKSIEFYAQSLLVLERRDDLPMTARNVE